MKTKLLFIVLLLLMGLASVGLLIEITTERQKISEIRDPLNKSTDILFKAVNLNLANTNAELEIWEYAFLSENKNLKNYQDYNRIMEDILKELQNDIKANTSYKNLSEERKKALAVSDTETMNQMIENLKKSQNTWDAIILSASDLKRRREHGDKSHAAILHDEYDTQQDKFEKQMSEAEAFLETENLSDSVRKFTESQLEMRKKLLSDFETKEAQISKNLFLLMSAFAILSLGLAGIMIFVMIKKR